MRGYAIVAGGLGLVVVSAAVVIASRWGQISGGPLEVIGVLLLELGPISKLAALMSVGLVVGAIAAASTQLGRSNSPADMGLLRLLALVAPLPGISAAALDAYTIHAAAQRIGDVSFAVVAPSVAGAALMAGAGLFSGALAAAAYAVVAGRNRSA
ncbi:hypothetical protein [Phenylobacterium sp.]|uniref:hypothetical protein n=1 Tax=Phenylobacterium sp. TaxID=1871053 RepID=UPI00301CA8CF